MLIQPNSTVHVLNNIDIDPDYNNSLTFTTTTAQYNYFFGKKKYTFSAQTYQRVNKNVVRVNRKADDLYDCCYLMFQNTSYGTRWFYAFIDSIEYVNDVTSNIYYHIDVIQTWLKDWTFKQCFVERMHTATDGIGDNIVDEHLDTGEMVFNEYRGYNQLIPLAIIVMVADTDDVGGELIDNCYSGATLIPFYADQNGVSDCNDYLQTFANKPDSVLGIYMAPAVIFAPFESGEAIAYSDWGFTNTWILDELTSSATIDSYTPRNKKLLTYPYNYLSIDNASGDGLILRYEFFNDFTPSLKMNGCLTMPVTITLEPYNYKGSERGSTAQDEHQLHTEILTLNGYPMCSWNMDSWKAWVAQNSLPLLANTTVSWAKTAIGASIGGSAVSLPNLALEKSIASTSDMVQGKANTIVQGGLSSTENILTQLARVSLQGDICRGNVNSGNVKLACHKQTFYGGRVSVDYMTASIIDSFFDKYGYAVNKIMTPSINTRPQWNYLKTIECLISGNIPSDDKKTICNIFNKGITFWHNPSNLGNYSLSNAPT